MIRPELSGERLREVRDTCEGDILYPEGEISVRCAETTLALLDYVGELEGVINEAMLLIGRDASISANYDARAEVFWRETHMMAPGKSEPLEMGSQWTHEHRQEAWNAWNETKIADFRDRIRSTLPQPPAADKEQR